MTVKCRVGEYLMKFMFDIDFFFTYFIKLHNRQRLMNYSNLFSWNDYSRKSIEMGSIIVSEVICRLALL